MEETKIWSIDGKSATPLNTTNQMESEGLLKTSLLPIPKCLKRACS